MVGVVGIGPRKQIPGHALAEIQGDHRRRATMLIGAEVLGELRQRYASIGVLGVLLCPGLPVGAQ